MMSPHRLFALGLLAVCLGLATLRFDHDHTILDEALLAQISGLDDQSQVVSMKEACDYSTATAYGGTTSDGCTGQPNGTVCWMCSGLQSVTTPIPNTSGGPGVKPLGGAFNCATPPMIDWVGFCISGTCSPYNPDTCSGIHPRYGDQ